MAFALQPWQILVGALAGWITGHTVGGENGQYE